MPKAMKIELIQQYVSDLIVGKVKEAKRTTSPEVINLDTTDEGKEREEEKAEKARGPSSSETGKSVTMASLVGIAPINLEAIVEEDDTNEEDETEWQTIVRKHKNIVSATNSSTINVPPIVKLSIEDVAPEIENWSQAIYGYVMGANPPWEMLTGYFRRIWKAYAIDKISFLPNGLFVVCFASLEHKELVLAKGNFLFDGKPIVIHSWTPEVKISTNVVKTMPIWVKRVGLDLKF